MKQSLIASGVIFTICCQANAQENSTSHAPQIAPAKPQQSLSIPGVIVPLSPPEALNGAQIEKKPVFGNFQYDNSLPERAIDVTLRSMFENYQISGPGRDNSFLEAGSHWLHDVELTARQPLGNKLQTEFNAIVRYTDTQRHDPSHWSVQRLQFIARDDVNHLTLGDYYATLSQYSLNQAIKGLGYQRNFSESTYLRFVGGTLAPRWDHIFGTPHNETIKRDVVGLRAQNSGDNYRIGFNLVSAWDHENSRARTTEDIYRQFLPAMDWEYRTNGGVRLSGEHAHSETRKDQVNGIRSNFAGTANRLNADGDLGKFRWRLRGERVSPDFYTLGGGAAVDRLRYYLRGDYRLDKTWSVFFANDWYRNNLEGQQLVTTRTHIPEFGLSARGLFDRRSMTLTTSLRQRRVENDSRQVSDRIYVSLNDRFSEVSLRGEVEAVLNKRRNSTGQQTSNDDYLYRFAVDSRHLLAGGKYDVRPYLTLEHQIIEDPQTGKSVITDGILMDVRLISQNNLTYAINFEHRNTNNSIPGGEDNKLLRYSASISARPAILGSGSIRAEAGKNHYDFSGSNKNYQERYIRLMFDIPFSLEK